MKKHVGSSFDGFLAKEGILGETDATAVKRVIAYQLSQFMEENKVYYHQVGIVGPASCVCPRQ